MHQIIQYGRLVKKRATIEKLVEKRGYTHARWCPAEPDKKSVGWILFARPKNYNRPYEDYKEEAAESIVSEDNECKGYRLVKEITV